MNYSVMLHYAGERRLRHLTEKPKYLRMDFNRLLKKYPLYLAIAGVALSFIFSLENYAFEKGMVNSNVMDTYMYAVQMSGKMIAYAFCASAFATVFCEDLENKYLRYSIGRGSLIKYVFSKTTVIYISSIITMVLGTFLFIVYLRMQLPWTGDMEMSNMSGMYEALWKNRHFITYILIYAVQMGMLSGALSLVSSFVSVIITNKMLIILTPVLIYQILMEFRGSGWANIMIFDPTLFQFKSDVGYFLIVCGFSLIPSIICTWGIYKKIKTRL